MSTPVQTLFALPAVLVDDDPAEVVDPLRHRGRIPVKRRPFEEDARSSSGSILAMAAASSLPPRRRLSSAGPAKAHSRGTCWSRTIPIRRASGSLVRRASASGLPDR